MSLAWNFPCLWSEVLSRVHGTQYTVYSAQCTVHSTQYTVYSGQYTVDSIQWTVYSGQYTVHSTQYTVQSTQYTVYSGQYTVDSAQCTVHSTQYTVYSGQYRVDSTQCTVHSTEYTVQSLSNRDGNEKGNVTKQVLMSKTTALHVRSGTFLQHSLQNNNVKTAVLKYYGEREHARCIVFFCLNLTAASLLINSATSGKLNINLSRSRLKRVNVFFEMTFTLTLPSGSL